MLLWQLVLIQVVTFIALILGLRLLFYQHLNSALRRLQRLHKENLEKEAALDRELERAKEERRQEVEKGRKDADRLKEEVKQEVETLKDEMASRARKEAQEIVIAAKKEAERTKREATTEIEERAIELSCDLVGSIFSQEGRADLHSRFFDEMLAEIEKLEADRLRVETDRAEAIVAFPLSGERKEALRRILSEKLSRKIQLEVKVDESIIAGLVINLDRLILDGSLANKLRKAALQMKKAV